MIFGPDIRAIVLDMDGVLWQSNAFHAAAYRAVLEGAGLVMPDYAMIAGRRTDEVMRDLLSAQRGGEADARTVAALTEAKQSHARKLLRERPPLLPDCVAVLRELARSRTVAIASSASAGTVALFLEASGTRPLFSAVVSGDDVAAAKPDPAIYAEALRRLRCEPAQAAVVEDAPGGVRAACAAGVALVVGMEGTASRGDLMRAGARLVVRTLRDLIAA